MNTSQAITKTWHNSTEQRVTKTFKARHSPSSGTVRFVRNRQPKAHLELATNMASPLSTREHWNDREYREAYMEAAVEQGIAWQIKINRKLRGMSQKELASAIGTRQSAISRLEDPEYGAHSLETLIDVAKAFDCALLVKFVSYSDLAYESEHLSEQDQYAIPYSHEIG